jgi:hypothetical protein
VTATIVGPWDSALRPAGLAGDDLATWVGLRKAAHRDELARFCRDMLQTPTHRIGQLQLDGKLLDPELARTRAALVDGLLDLAGAAMEAATRLQGEG